MKKNYTINTKAHNGFQTFETKIIVDGLFMYKECTSAYESIKDFVTDFFSDTAEFDECYGSFRIIIEQGSDKYYIADNSGMMRFYINMDKNMICESLLEAEPKSTMRKPNYNAIAQLLYFGCTYNYETIIKSVILSNPNYYYVKNNETLMEKRKNLKALCDYNKDITIERLVKQARLHYLGKIGCTITGGIDSRTILANLVSEGIRPTLAISGKDEQVDVRIAKKIATTLDLNCLVVSDEADENNWIEKAYSAADGCEGICGIYRLNKYARKLKAIDIELQFGGLNGEMYKNSFINQDFPFYFGKANWRKYYKYKIATFDIDKHLFGSRMQSIIESLPIQIIEWLSTHDGISKADKYLAAGYEIMQARCNLNVNMFSKYVAFYNPLMERKMAAYAFGENPYKFEMQAFQREEVTKLCPEIMNIETDRGLTCNLKRKNVEFIKSYLYIIKIGLQRLFNRKKVDIRIDSSFTQGMNDERLAKSLDRVKEMDIINHDVSIDDIPVRLVDRLFTIGLVFSDEVEK